MNFVRGGSATLRLDKLDQERIVLDVGLSAPVAADRPFAALRSIGSDVRALFSLEVGKRREGEDEEKQNRRLAGGFAVSF